MITLTVVRHGESTDNLKPKWAGWADAPLSVHGMNQAKALGESYKSTKVDAIFASDLKRALWTAQQIQKNQSEPQPPLTVSPLLREQHFGIAEGKPFGEGLGGFVRGPGRRFRFDNGETLDDVRARANEMIATFIEPFLRECIGLPSSCKHVVVVAHGIFNSEFLGALLARTHVKPLEWGYKGMTNTGWTRAELGYVNEGPRPEPVKIETNPENPIPASSTPLTPPPTAVVDKDLPPLSVRILCSDVTKHLDGVHRQKGGIGSQGFDEKQKDLRRFFGGGSNN